MSVGMGRGVHQLLNTRVHMGDGHFHHCPMDKVCLITLIVEGKSIFMAPQGASHVFEELYPTGGVWWLSQLLWEAIQDLVLFIILDDQKLLF